MAGDDAERGRARRRDPDRRRRGSVITYGVAGFMLVALLVYLIVAYFADEPGTAEPSDPPAASEHAD